MKQAISTAIITLIACGAIYKYYLKDNPIDNPDSILAVPKTGVVSTDRVEITNSDKKVVGALYGETTLIIEAKTKSGKVIKTDLARALERLQSFQEKE